MRPAGTFFNFQLSNSRVFETAAGAVCKGFGEGCQIGKIVFEHIVRCCNNIPSLTVSKRKNRCISCIYWAVAIFFVVANYSNLFFSLTFFLNCPHFTFGYELIIGAEATDLMKVICDSFPFV